jgi:hypothetical protein
MKKVLLTIAMVLAFVGLAQAAPTIGDAVQVVQNTSFFTAQVTVSGTTNPVTVILTPSAGPTIFTTLQASVGDFKQFGAFGFGHVVSIGDIVSIVAVDTVTLESQSGFISCHAGPSGVQCNGLVLTAGNCLPVKLK